MREALEQIVVATPRRQYAFLVEHEPSLLMMKRPLRVTLPPPLNPRMSSQMPIVAMPSNRSLTPLSEILNPAQLGRPRGFRQQCACFWGNAPLGELPQVQSGRLSQQQSSYPAFLGGIGLATALLALALVIWRVAKPVEPVVQPAALVDAGAAAVSPVLPPIRVGVQLAVGTMAISTRPIVEATLLAIDEINDAGGLPGGALMWCASTVH